MFTGDFLNNYYFINLLITFWECRTKSISSTSPICSIFFRVLFHPEVSAVISPFSPNFAWCQPVRSYHLKYIRSFNCKAPLQRNFGKIQVQFFVLPPLSWIINLSLIVECCNPSGRLLWRQLELCLNEHRRWVCWIRRVYRTVSSLRVVRQIIAPLIYHWQKTLVVHDKCIRILSGVPTSVRTYEYNAIEVDEQRVPVDGDRTRTWLLCERRGFTPRWRRWTVRRTSPRGHCA